MMASEVKPSILPRNDLVLLLLDPEVTVSPGGIQLVAGRPVSKATVVAIGPGAVSDAIPPPHRLPMDLVIGQRVYVGGNKFACEFVDGDDRLILLPEKQILGTLVEGA